MRDAPPVTPGVDVALRLHRDTVIVRPESGSSWAVRTPRNQLLGVGKGLGELLQALQHEGPITSKDLARKLGKDWTVGEVEATIDSVERYGLVLSAYEVEQEAPRRPFGIDHDGPFVLKLCFNRPERLFRTLATYTSPLRNSWARWIPPAVSVLGIGLLVQLLTDPSGALYQPLPLATYGLLLVSMMLTTAVHELAHGLTLAAFGGLPHRVGVMLFYFSPAAFCDVTEAWLLPRRQRVAVAAGGIIVQTCVGTAALLVSLLWGGSAILAWYGASTYLVAFSNLLPFLRLDGYVALVGYTNQSGLRKRSMTALRDRIAGTSEQEEPPWVAFFGLGCVITPFIIVWAAVSTLAPNLIRGGSGGRVMLSMLIGFCLSSLVMKLVHGLRHLRTMQRLRLVGAGAVATALVLMAPIPTSTSLGFQAVDEHHAAALVSGAQVGSTPVDDGTTVTFHRAGLLNGPSQGTGLVTGRQDCTVPVSATSPLLSNAMMPAGTCIIVRTDLELADGATGRIKTETEYQPLAQVIRTRLGALLPGGVLFSNTGDDS